ncbi:MAG: aspartyl/asparaginyl beta-hydroxylase domain-containing protein [Polymorphobacter sp.]
MADDPAQLNAAGLRALGQGDPLTAAALLARAAAADPASPLLWYNLSTAHGAAGDTAAESAALDKALDRDPYFDHALLCKGRLHEAAGEAPQAMEYYQRLLAATDPKAPAGPGFTAGLAHARAYIARANEALASRLDTALASQLAALADDDSRRFRHFVDASLGRRRLYHHQPLVLHYPYLPEEQFLARAHFPWLAQLEAATPVIRAELQALLAAGGEGFAPYVAYPPGVPVNQWATLNHSDAWSAQFLIQHGVPNDVMRTRCPQTAALLDTLPLFDLATRGPVAFFSLLKPRTHIPPHTGATNIRTIIHLPLIVPPGCEFRVGNETRPWVVGQAFAFDDTIEHEAVNPSDELRAVLIIDTWNPYIPLAERDLLRGYVAALAASGNGLQGFDPG